jgi:regulator of sigma E protease
MGSNLISTLLGGDFAGWIVPFLLGVAKWTIPFLVVLTIIVFIHELGHFLIARWCGIRVLTFSIGFGPELIGFDDRHGTRWKVSAIPLGGYVKFLGDENAASVPDQATMAAMTEQERRESYPGQPVGARAAVAAAGPIANFILAIAMFAGIFLAFGKPVVVDGRPVLLPQIAAIQPGSPAAAAGFVVHDRIVAIDNTKVESFGDVQRLVGASGGRSLAFEVDRGGSVIAIDVVPAQKDQKWLLGITGTIEMAQVGVVEAVNSSVQQTWFIISNTMSSLWDIVLRRQSADQIGGVIRIAQFSGEAAQSGMDLFLSWIAGLSVSIGLLNLFPIPLLDGGHLLFYAFEAVRGRPLSDRAQDVGFKIGLAIISLLMIFALRNDLLHLWS